MPDDYLSHSGTSGRLSVGSPVTGMIEEAYDQDWFQIYLASGVTYVFNEEGSPTSAGTLGDSYLRLYDSFGSQLAYNDDYGGSYNSQITYMPAASGIYYVAAGGYSSHTGSYRLSATAEGGSPPPPPPPPPDTAGGSRADPRWMDFPGATPQTVTEYIGGTDSNDYFMFTAPAAVDLSATLSGMTSDVNIELLNATGTAASSSNPSVSSELLNVSSLPAGTYWFRIYPGPGAESTSTSYTLTWSAPTSYVPPPPPTDNAGNTSAAAYSLGGVSETAVTATDYIGNTDTDDYYSFVTTGPTNLTAQLTGTSADANVVLLDSSGSNPVSGTSGGATVGSGDETLTRSDLPAGTYYLRVTSSATTATGYTLSVTAPSSIPADEAGNTPDEARSIGTALPSFQTFADYVGSEDTVDYYRFATTSLTNLRMNLTGLSNDVNVLLLNSSGSPVSGTSGGSTAGTADEAVTRDNLAAGTYLVQVYPASATAGSRYSLSLAALPAAAIDTAGNTTAAALDMGTLTSTALTQAEQVGDTDVDVYRFAVTSTSAVSFRLSDMVATANLELLNAGGTVVQRTSASRSETGMVASFSRNIAAGSYFVRVSPQGGADTNYTLTLSSAPTDRVGNTVTLARTIANPLSLGGTAVSSREFVGDVDTLDYYRFSVNSRCTITATLNGMDGDANVALVNTLNRTIVESNNSGADDTFSRAVTPGTYYLKIIENGLDTNYNLSLSARAADTAGGDTATAKNMGIVGAAPLRSNDWVGTTTDGSRDVDVYRFQVRTAGNVSFRLSDMTGDADLELLNSTGDVLQRSSTAGATPDAFTRRLTPGAYYVRVNPDGSAETSYNIGLALAIPDNGPDTIAAARDLGRRFPATVSDYVGQTSNATLSSVNDTNDYYKFVLVARSDINLALGNMTGNADLALLDDDARNSIIRTSATSGTANESIGMTLEAGTYFVRVSDAGDDTSYQLTLNSTILDGAGGTISEPKDLGVVATRPSTHSDYIRASDIDYYQFVVNTAGTVAIAFSELNTGTSISASVRSATDAVIANYVIAPTTRPLSQRLSPGTYFVRVASNRGETDYRIALSTSSGTSTRPSARSADLADSLASAGAAAPLGTAAASLSTPFGRDPLAGSGLLAAVA